MPAQIFKGHRKLIPIDQDQEPAYPDALQSIVDSREYALKRGRIFWGKWDSILPDSIVRDVTATEGNDLYQMARSSKDEYPPIIIASYMYDNIAFVRGTLNLEDWILNANKFFGTRNDRWITYVNRIQTFLRKNPDITDLIGHSLGMALAYDAIANSNGEFNHIKLIGMDGAAILINEKNDFSYVRNINSSGAFDVLLNPYGPIETIACELDSSGEDDLSRSKSVGHNCFKYKYTPYFQKEINKLLKLGYTNIQTGYLDGIVRGDPPIAPSPQIKTKHPFSPRG